MEKGIGERVDSTMASQACEKHALPIRPPRDSDHVPKNDAKMTKIVNYH